MFWQRVARVVSDRLAVTDVTGSVGGPGYGASNLWFQKNGVTLELLAREEAFDLYISTPRLTYNFPIERKTLFRIVWWLINWWVKETWFGIKSYLWRKTVLIAINSNLVNKNPPVRNVSRSRVKSSRNV